MDWIKDGKDLEHMFDEVVEHNPYTAWDGVAGDVMRVKDSSKYPHAVLTASFYKVVGTDYWMVYNHLVKSVKFYIEDEQGGDDLENRYLPITGFAPISADCILDAAIDEKLKEDIVYTLDKVR